MPQTTVLPVFRVDYPILAKAQKPGGVTVLSVVTSNDVPNKFVPFTATIQLASIDPQAETAAVQEEAVNEEEYDEEDTSEDEWVEDENGHKKPKSKPKSKAKHKR